MYNQYIPSSAPYEAAQPEPFVQDGAAGEGGAAGGRGLSGLLERLLGGRGEQTGAGQAVKSLLSALHLEDIDTGDILLALIVLFLILEDGDSLDVILTLGLMLLFSLGER